MKLLVFDLTKIPFLVRLIGISRLIVEVLDDQNLFTESNLANLFCSYVQFCSGGHFSERTEAARWCGKMNHLKRSESIQTSYLLLNEPEWILKQCLEENFIKLELFLLKGYLKNSF